MKKQLLLGLLMVTMAGQVFAEVPHAAAAAQQVSANQTGNIIASVHLRKGASTSSSVIRLMTKGEKVTILDKHNSYWYKVRDAKGNTGYMSTSSKYIQVANSGTSNTPAQPNETGNIIASVHLRKGASTSSSVIRLMTKGEKVTILDKLNSYWYKVRDSKGNTGYMSTSSKYIQVANSSTSNTPAVSGQAAKIEKVIQVGKKYLGTPYEFGSNRSSTKTFDCSDFVRQAYKEALGITLPTDSRKQGSWIKSNSTAKTSISQLKRGDLMFFMSYKGSKASNYKGVNKSTERITHVGIYLGDGKILHTYSKNSGGVRVDNVLNNTWQHRFLFGGSVVK